MTMRLLAACAGLSLWLLLLLVGWAGGGAVHGLLLAAALIFPWRELDPNDIGDQGGELGDEPGPLGPSGESDGAESS